MYGPPREWLDADEAEYNASEFFEIVGASYTAAEMGQMFQLSDQTLAANDPWTEN